MRARPARGMTVIGQRGAWPVAWRRASRTQLARLLVIQLAVDSAPGPLGGWPRLVHQSRSEVGQRAKVRSTQAKRPIAADAGIRHRFSRITQ